MSPLSPGSLFVVRGGYSGLLVLQIAFGESSGNDCEHDLFTDSFWTELEQNSFAFEVQYLKMCNHMKYNSVWNVNVYVMSPSEIGARDDTQKLKCA